MSVSLVKSEQSSTAARVARADRIVAGLHLGRVELQGSHVRHLAHIPYLHLNHSTAPLRHSR